MTEFPKYTIRIKPTMKPTEGSHYTFGGPLVMLVDDHGNEVARLVGIAGVSLDLNDEMFAEVSMRIVQFEWERAETLWDRVRTDDEGVA